MIDLSEFPVVTEPSEEFLNQRQLLDYRSERETSTSDLSGLLVMNTGRICSITVAEEVNVVYRYKRYRFTTR